jgi:hypothetical protein
MPATRSACSKVAGSAALTNAPDVRNRSAFVPAREDPAGADQDDFVGDDLDLVQKVRREQDGPPVVGEVAQEFSHPVDARGIEAVSRLVEDED